MTAMTHGYSTYAHGRCRCPVCREAWRLWHLAWRQRPRDLADLRHGESSTYRNYGCRCDPCRAAESARQRRQAAAP